MLLRPTKSSIDMIRLYKDISNSDFQYHLKPQLDYYMLLPNLKYWESFHWKGYRHNWTYSEDKINERTGEHIKYSYYFAYSLNLHESTKQRLVIEFNPNKIKIKNDRLLNYIISQIFNNDFYIQSIDVAFDYEGVNTKDLIIDKSFKREYKLFQYEHTITHYIGKNDGRIKIYDKAEEQGTKALGELTRYEISCNISEHINKIKEYGFNYSMPNVYIISITNEEELNGTDKAILFAIKNGYPITELPRKKREKIKKYLEDQKYVYSTIAPTMEEIKGTLDLFLSENFDFY